MLVYKKDKFNKNTRIKANIYNNTYANYKAQSTQCSTEPNDWKSAPSYGTRINSQYDTVAQMLKHGYTHTTHGP